MGKKDGPLANLAASVWMRAINSRGGTPGAANGRMWRRRFYILN
jgi:hypothetical protein